MLQTKMTRSKLDIIGMPYFPGMAVGKLLRGIHGDVTQHIVLVTQDEIAEHDTSPAGVIVIEAAPFSHGLITLLGLGIPTVLISQQQAKRLQDVTMVRIDGMSGRITDDISETHHASVTGGELLTHFSGQAAVLADGEPLNLQASVRLPSLAKQAAQLGAQAIGLVRTEFLMPKDGSIPDAGFYQAAFRAICEAAAPLTVTFRLLDVTGDKMPAWFPDQAGVGRPLGLNGVRLYSLALVAMVVDAQLAALAELAHEFNLRVLIPFLVRVEEYEYWRDKIRQRLPAHIPIGAMAETPASVLDMAALLQHADFVAIGCNDLMQGLYAADRDMAELRHYLDPYAPLLFRLLRQAAEQAGEHRQHIQLCGVLSQLQGIFPVLLGLGYRTFSVDTPIIPYLAAAAARVTASECEKLAGQVCAAITTQEVVRTLQLVPDRHAPFLH